jgi:hypothetical protein
MSTNFAPLVLEKLQLRLPNLILQAQLRQLFSQPPNRPRIPPRLQHQFHRVLHLPELVLEHGRKQFDPELTQKF